MRISAGLGSDINPYVNVRVLVVGRPNVNDPFERIGNSWGGAHREVRRGQRLA